jgi:rod shape-determining protein MreD
MKKWIFLLIILFCFFGQAGFPELLRVFGVSADLLFICVVASSLFFGRKTAVLFGLLCGILKDLLDIQIFGIHTLLFTLISLLLAELSRRLSVENNYLAAVIVFLAGLIYAVLARLVFNYIDNVIPLGIFLRIAVLQAIYSAFLFSLFFRFLKKVIGP